ncbi:MAG: cbb3-type cytochrome c oxidase N-terminal domain-containing protein [Saprospiraceae bacterium]|nr:cbb3-type cytochrome c oxidase N-terminal domain-containing protein [Saprospiraceae bacterium]
MTSKKYLPTLLLILTNLTMSWGQAVSTAVPSKTDGLTSIMTTAFMISAVLLFIIVIAVVVRTNAMLTKHLINLESEKRGIYMPTESVELRPVEEDVFTRLRKKYWENPVPREMEGAITLDHNYDGIRELDNHLPPWWVNMFILTVIWSVGYMWYYHWGGNGLNQADEYKKDVAAAKKEIAIALAGKASEIDESNVTLLTDASAIGEGELIYKSVCVACHGAKGEGTVGPNFTDEYWIHGGGIKDLFKTIKYGVPDKGMIAWAAQLKPADMQKVASYILTLKGTNPPNPKDPQGAIWKEEAAATQDSTSVQ